MSRNDLWFLSTACLGFPILVAFFMFPLTCARRGARSVLRSFWLRRCLMGGELRLHQVETQLFIYLDNEKNIQERS